MSGTNKQDDDLTPIFADDELFSAEDLLSLAALSADELTEEQMQQWITVVNIFLRHFGSTKVYTVSEIREIIDRDSFADRCFRAILKAMPNRDKFINRNANGEAKAINKRKLKEELARIWKEEIFAPRQSAAQRRVSKHR